MATQTPLTSPWIITVPADTNEHTLDMNSILNGKILPNLPMKVKITKISGPIQFRVVGKGSAANQIDANNPSVTTTDTVELALYANQEIRFKGGVGSETFNIAAV